MITRLLILFSLTIFATSSFSQQWNIRSPFPGKAVDDGVSFFLGGKGYCGTGLSNDWSPQATFFAYDTYAQKWDTLPPLPFERQYAIGFATNEYGFVGLGRAHGQTLNDLWQYDPILNTWNQKASMPFSGVSGAACFVLEEEVYVVGGQKQDGSFSNAVWKYEVSSDSWEVLQDFPFGPIWRASGVALEQKGYILLGQKDLNHYNPHVYEYHPQNDNWSTVTTFPGEGRSYVQAVPLFDRIYTIGGIDSTLAFQQDLWEYRPASNLWTQLPAIPDTSRRGGMAFTDQVNIHYVSGLLPSSLRTQQHWSYSLPTGRLENEEYEEVKLYPNPFVTQLNIENTMENGSISIYSLTGRRLYTTLVKKGITTISPQLPKGMYYAIFQSNSEKKVIAIHHL